MPNMDGFTTLLKRSVDIDPIIPLFLLSARPWKKMIQGYKLGADDYITNHSTAKYWSLKIKRILKRNEGKKKRKSENKEFDLASYHFNPKLRQLIHNGITQTLSPRKWPFENAGRTPEWSLPREQALKRYGAAIHTSNGQQHGRLHCENWGNNRKDDLRSRSWTYTAMGFRLVVQWSRPISKFEGI